MKQWLIIIGLLLVLFLGGYLVVFRSIVPKAAKMFVPVKWQNVPLGEKRLIVHEYLGAPKTSTPGNDHWEQRLSKIKRYTLDVGYRQDSVSVNYRIVYEVEIFGLPQRTIVRADTLR